MGIFSLPGNKVMEVKGAHNLFRARGSLSHYSPDIFKFLLR